MVRSFGWVFFGIGMLFLAIAVGAWLLGAVFRMQAEQVTGRAYPPAHRDRGAHSSLRRWQRLLPGRVLSHAPRPNLYPLLQPLQLAAFLRSRPGSAHLL